MSQQPRFVSAFLLFAALLPLEKPVHAAEKPNVLFLFADDLSFEAIRAIGKIDIETPNLDRLVRQGTTFTHAYNMGSYSGAVCVASRTMLVTGRSVWRAEELHNKAGQEREAGRLWPQLMSQAGYDTYFTGKWHVRADAQKTFDTVKHVRGGMPDQTPEGYNRPLNDQPDAWSPSDPKFGGYWEGGKHWSEVVGEDAVEFIHTAKSSSHPFFMYIAFNAAHDPRQSPAEYVEKYPLDRVMVPENFLPLYPYAESIGAGKKLRDEKLAPFPRTEQAVKVHRQEYFALITHMDVQIGRILNALQAAGLAENTWIIFTADHGLAVGHHGLMGKQNLYEHSTCVPFIISGPEAPVDEKIDTPIYLQDAMPTSLEIAGAAIPDWVEFQSVLPLLRHDSDAKHRDAIYGGYLKLQRSITANGWKLIVYPQAAKLRLYHLAEDPEEMHDLADEPAQAARVQNLFQELQQLQQDLADPLDLSQSFPQFSKS